jgi:hypothetical protein
MMALSASPLLRLISLTPDRAAIKVKSRVNVADKMRCQVRGLPADVIVRKYAREVQKLDFVSGCVLISADDKGFVIVPNRVDLEPFISELPKLAHELQKLVSQREAELQQATGFVGGRRWNEQRVVIARDRRPGRSTMGALPCNR